MKVTVTEVPREVSFVRPDEVWVQVLANRMAPWGEIQKFLEEHEPVLYASCKPEPVECFEAELVGDEPYEFEDWYILERVKS